MRSDRAKLGSYWRVFVKFVVFLVENFIFNVSFEIYARTNSILHNGHLQAACGLTSPQSPLLCVMVAL